MKKINLQTAVRLLATVTELKSSLPVLSTVLIQNDGPDHVRLRATDLDREMVVRVAGHLLGADATCFFIKQLRRVLDAGWNPIDALALTVEGPKLIVACGSQKVCLDTLPVDQFPEPFYTPTLPVVLAATRVNAMQLLEDTEWVRLATTTDETRFNLLNLRFEPTGRVWAASGATAHIRQMDKPLAPIPMNVHARTLDVLKTSLGLLRPSHITLETFGRDPDLDVAPAIYAEHLQRYTFMDSAERALSGVGIRVELYNREDTRIQMPDMDQILPASDTMPLIGRRVKTAALQTAARFAVKLELEWLDLSVAVGDPFGALRISGNNDGTRFEDRVEVIGGEIRGSVFDKDDPSAPFTVRCSAAFLLDALAGMGDEFQIELTDDLGPLVLRSNQNVALIMPMKRD